MSIFSSVMSKLGFGNDVKPAAPEAVQQAVVAVQAAPAEPVAEVVAAPQVVDIESQLSSMNEANGGNLNWKTSIVDLLKLVGVDSSLAHRKELAKELGCPEDLMDDSASMNIWLHKNMLAQMAINGGNVPSNLL